MPEKPERPHRYDENFPKDLFDRANKATWELRKVVLSFSSASLGVFFIALTTKIDPPLKEFEKFILSGAVILFSIAVLAGLLVWYSESAWAYWWGRALQGEEDDRYQEFARKKRRFLAMRKVTNVIQMVFFALGMFSIIIYLIARMFA